MVETNRFCAACQEEGCVDGKNGGYCLMIRRYQDAKALDGMTEQLHLDLKAEIAKQQKISADLLEMIKSLQVTDS